MCIKAASIVYSMPKSVVAVVGIYTFYGFTSLLIIRFYFPLCWAYLTVYAKVLWACLTFQAKRELDQNKKAIQNGTDQRGIIQVCNTNYVYIYIFMYCTTHTHAFGLVWRALQ